MIQSHLRGKPATYGAQWTKGLGHGEAQKDCQMLVSSAGQLNGNSVGVWTVEHLLSKGR